MLSRLLVVVQAAVLDCQFLDLFPLFNDSGVAPCVGAVDVAGTIPVMVAPFNSMAAAVEVAAPSATSARPPAAVPTSANG